MDVSVTLRRRETLALGAAALAAPAAVRAVGNGAKVLRIAFPIAETTFDPAAINDVYSRTITGHIFEALYTYDPLAQPAKIVPLTATGMPEVENDFRRFTIRIWPGIFFADDAAFKGQRRELTAADYVYAFKRFADPAVKSPLWSSMESWKALGLAELRQRAVDSRQPFDYDAPIEGLKALDRQTLQINIAEARPRFVESLAISELFGGFAREVAEAYGERVGEHPVGTGPFMLKQWRRSSLIVLERNPGYRQRAYEADPAPDDAEGQAIAAQLRGKALPLVDRVEVSIIEAQQPRWLSFLNEQADFIERVPPEFINLAMPGGKVAPNLAKRGIRGHRVLSSDLVMTYYNMDDPVLGGLAPHKVALRRALNLAVDIEREIRLFRRGMAIPAQSPVIPHTSGYDPAFKSEMSEYSPARARALLDLFGYVDRDGDGWREQPDGTPLVIRFATQTEQSNRQFDELRKRDLSAIGINCRFEPAKWPENLKAARAGRLMAWTVGSLAAAPDGQDIFSRYYGPQAGQQNLSRFSLPEFDRLYERMERLPDGPEREKLFVQAKRLAVAYAPYKLHVHRYVLDMAHPWVFGYRRPAFILEWWHQVDVEPGRAVA